MPVCYRNTPWALTLAHALGFGIYAEGGQVQYFQNPDTWTEIGYEIVSGKLVDNEEVTLRRGPDSYPDVFDSVLTPGEAVSAHTFSTKDEQYAWIAEEIRKNLEEEELDPDDIMVIFSNAITQQQEYYELRNFLESKKIQSELAGITNDRDLFSQQGSITVSAIWRAKGNEAPMVYFANADYCWSGYDLIRMRNILFTGMTRSRAWLRVCGVGDAMSALQKEIDQVIKSDFQLAFRNPTEEEKKNRRSLNREKTVEETRRNEKTEKAIRQLEELMKRGSISPDLLPRLNKLRAVIDRESRKAKE